MREESPAVDPLEMVRAELQRWEVRPNLVEPAPLLDRVVDRLLVQRREAARGLGAA